MFSFLLAAAFAVSAMGSPHKTINVDELVKYQTENKVLIVDVREPSEIKETGIIPGGINIPSAEVEKAFLKSPEDFESTYGKKKPEKTDEIIVSCRSGKRSAVATDKLVEMGYTKAINFSGGWTAWEKYKMEKQ